MGLSYADVVQLMNDGFQDFEIEEFSQGRTPSGRSQPAVNINSPLWESVRRNRRNWYYDKRNRGWSDVEIRDEIRRYYLRRRERTPWDFLKAEYKPPMRLDYKTTIKARAEVRKFGVQRYKAGPGRSRRKRS